MIGTAAAGGIVAVPTSHPIMFIIVYGRGRGVPRPYQSIKTKSKALELPRYYSAGVDARHRPGAPPLPHTLCGVFYVHSDSSRYENNFPEKVKFSKKFGQKSTGCLNNAQKNCRFFSFSTILLKSLSFL